jgi:hypothetical protein
LIDHRLENLSEDWSLLHLYFIITSSVLRASPPAELKAFSNLQDKINDFVLNELIDSLSSHDDDNFILTSEIE